MKTLLLLFALASCSQISEIQEFEAEASFRGCPYIRHNIYFTNMMDDSFAGYCAPLVGIFLSKEKWNTYGKYQRLELVYHEMGHCALGYGHGDDDSIMSPTMHSEEEIEKSWAVWVDQFFADCK